MLSPCGVPTGMEGRRKGRRERILSPQSSENAKQRKQNGRAGNCEQTVERIRGGVRVLHECGGCECQRGEVFLPHATDKSHLSGRSQYKT